MAFLYIFYDTSLHIACQNGYSLFVKLFLYHHKIDVNIQNFDVLIQFCFKMEFQLFLWFTIQHCILLARIVIKRLLICY